MYTFDPTFQPDPGEMRLFATSRPSRLCEVAGPEPVFARRKEQDMAWAAAIGIDSDRLETIGTGITGSPSGTTKPHTADDLWDDIGR
jgi:hypothetical protein